GGWRVPGARAGRAPAGVVPDSPTSGVEGVSGGRVLFAGAGVERFRIERASAAQDFGVHGWALQSRTEGGIRSRGAVRALDAAVVAGAARAGDRVEHRRTVRTQVARVVRPRR